MNINQINKNKRADMPFWLVMLIVALIFGTVIILFMSGGINRLKQTLTGIEIKTTGQSTCLPASSGEDADSDGWKDTGDYTDASGLKVACDKFPTDSSRH